MRLATISRLRIRCATYRIRRSGVFGWLSALAASGRHHGVAVVAEAPTLDWLMPLALPTLGILQVNSPQGLLAALGAGLDGETTHALGRVAGY
jgi:hypothetical protein